MRLTIRIISVLIFVACLIIGVKLASLKPLWGDEVFSQSTQVQKLSHWQMLYARSGESNNAPLFFSIQKIICDVFSYRLDHEWQGSVELTDPKAQNILRWAPNLCMSLSLAILFYFFAKHYSLGLGIFALTMGLSSFIVWGYWAEARHYPLWFLLTLVQALMYVRIIQTPQSERIQWGKLALVHGLLALTTPVSLVQIGVASMLLWVFKAKDLKTHVFLTVIPLLICLFYYAISPRASFSFQGDPLNIMELVVHQEWVWILLLYMVFLFFVRKTSYWPLICFTGILLVGVWLGLLGYRTFGPTQGPEFTYRYLLLLAPVAIVTVCCFVADMLKSLRHDRWLQAMVIVAIAGMLIIRFLKTYMLVLGQYKW